MKTTLNIKGIEFVRINNDVNGNPRYVCHFFDLLKANERNQSSKEFDLKMSLEQRYFIALLRARTIGGKKFHNKQYGGGIVFQSYNIGETAQEILNLTK